MGEKIRSSDRETENTNCGNTEVENPPSLFAHYENYFDLEALRTTQEGLQSYCQIDFSLLFHLTDVAIFNLFFRTLSVLVNHGYVAAFFLGFSASFLAAAFFATGFATAFAFPFHR